MPLRLVPALLPLCLWASAVALPAQPPWEVGYRDLSFPNPTAVGSRLIHARVFYPAQATGLDTPIRHEPGGWPVVVFLHGYTLPGSMYLELGYHLAEHGYVAVLKTTTLTDANLQRDDATALLPALYQENWRRGSMLEGQLDTARAALVGHSMGGGNVIRVLAQNPGFRAGILLAPWTGSNGELTAKSAGEVQAPVLIVCGKGDVITPWDSNAQTIYEQLRRSDFRALHVLNQDCDHGNVVSWLWANDQRSRSVFQEVMTTTTGMLDHFVRDDARALDNVVGLAARSQLRLDTLRLRVGKPQYFKAGSEEPDEWVGFYSVGEPGIALHYVAAGRGLVPTPYGDYLLDPLTSLITLIGLVGQERLSPNVFRVPKDVRLRGQVIPFQALASCRDGLRYTRVVELEIPLPRVSR